MKHTSITIKIPSELLKLAQSLETETESFNDLVQTALEKEIKRRKNWTAHQTILKVRQEIKETTGVHPDPIPVIRQLREGNNNDE
ncbi:MAG: YlcI/YnfO family protein [Crocosphaera sp.]|nr:YlcI/YnfO family protein [Crocosphaera sp.]